MQTKRQWVTGPLAATLLNLFILTTSWAQSSEAPFTLGVLPNISPRILLTHYQPMREYLSQQLGREVVISTSANFKTFAAETQRGAFDMIVTAPNLGMVAKTDQGWQPLASYQPKIPALLVALKSNTKDDVSQLRNKSLALANPQSLVALVGMKLLEEQGLKQGHDYKIAQAANDESLGNLLHNGEAPLAMMSMGEFRAKPEAMRSTLRIVKVLKELPGFLVMSNPRMPDDQRKKMQTLMRDFPNADLGKRYFTLSGFKNIGPVDEEGLRYLTSFVDQTRTGLCLQK